MAKFTDVVTLGDKGSPLSYPEMDTNWNNLRRGTIPVGGIIIWPSELALPVTYLECDGSSLLVANYGDLHTELGYRYGGSGANFLIPDYRGLFLRHQDGGAGIDPDAASRTDRGDSTTGDAMGTKQDSANRNHQHFVHYYKKGVGGGSGTDADVLVDNDDPLSALTVTTGVSGSSNDEARPKNIYVKYIIKALPQ